MKLVFHISEDDPEMLSIVHYTLCARANQQEIASFLAKAFSKIAL